MRGGRRRGVKQGEEGRVAVRDSILLMARARAPVLLCSSPTAGLHSTPLTASPLTQLTTEEADLMAEASIWRILGVMRAASIWPAVMYLGAEAQTGSTDSVSPSLLLALHLHWRLCPRTPLSALSGFSRPLMLPPSAPAPAICCPSPPSSHVESLTLLLLHFASSNFCLIQVPPQAFWAHITINVLSTCAAAISLHCGCGLVAQTLRWLAGQLIPHCW